MPDHIAQGLIDMAEDDFSNSDTLFDWLVEEAGLPRHS